MKIIPRMWQFAELCSHEPNGNEPLLKDSLFTRMRNDLDFGFISDFYGEIVICFEGTKNLKAWISDFDMTPLRKDYLPIEGSWGKGIIADGFYTGWSYFKDPITQYLKRTLSGRYPAPPIICTGHSRGGALATLCARHIAKNMKIPCSCISFGAPAQGIIEYRNELNLLPINHTRVVHGYDIVPSLPPSSLGFRHGGSKKWLSESITHKLPWMRIKDHYYSTYTKALMKYCKESGDSEGYEAMKFILLRTKI